MKKSVKKLPHFLSQDEVTRLLRAVRKDRHRLGLALMSYGGLRVSEVGSLRVRDLHLAREYITVHGKGGKDRIVPVNRKLLSAIETYLQKYGQLLDQDSLLVGRHRSTWHRAVKKYALHTLDAGGAVHCHTLRHSFATGLYEKGVPIERISQILGHANLDTTMIYSHISLAQKKDAVARLDGRASRFRFLTASFRRRPDISVTRSAGLVGRDAELAEVNRRVSEKVSVILYGAKGVGKTAILRRVENAVYIAEYRKKQTLAHIILENRNIDDPAVRKEVDKNLRKLSIDELLAELANYPRVIVIDDITGLSKTDKSTVAKLAAVTTVVSSSSKPADKKLFTTFIDVKPLRRHHTRQVLHEMIVMTDPAKKERVVDDILHQAGDNLKEAEYIASQVSLGKTGEEITTEERSDNQVSIAPFLLIMVLFFVAWVLKSYATTMVAFSYAMLVVFRLVFYKYIFTPTATARKR